MYLTDKLFEGQGEGPVAVFLDLVAAARRSPGVDLACSEYVGKARAEASGVGLAELVVKSRRADRQKRLLVDLLEDVYLTAALKRIGEGKTADIYVFKFLDLDYRLVLCHLDAYAVCEDILIFKALKLKCIAYGIYTGRDDNDVIICRLTLEKFREGKRADAIYTLLADKLVLVCVGEQTAKRAALGSVVNLCHAVTVDACIVNVHNVFKCVSVTDEILVFGERDAAASGVFNYINILRRGGRDIEDLVEEKH